MPVVAVLLVTLGALALASDFLWAGREPWVSGLTMQDLGLHGPGVAAKGLAVLGLVMLVGAVTGRSLPAVAVGLVLCFGLYVGGGVGMARWLQASAIEHATTSTGNPQELFPGGTNFFQGWLAPDGRVLVSSIDALAYAPPGVNESDWLSAGPANGGLQIVQMGVPGSEYPTWSLIETVGFGAIGLVALGLVFLIVDRRRPM